MKKGVIEQRLALETQRKSNKQVVIILLLILSLGYVLVISFCIRSLVKNKALFGTYHYEAWVPITLMIIATIFYTIVILLFIKFDKKSHRVIQIFDEIMEIYDWQRLIHLLHNPPKSLSIGRRKYRRWINERLIQIDSTRALKHFAKQLNEEFENEEFNYYTIDVFSSLVDYEDRDTVYEIIQESILIIQKEYYRVKLLGALNSTNNNPVESEMELLAEVFGFNNLDDFTTLNVIYTFKMIFPKMKPEKPVHMKRIAELSRVSEAKIHRVLELLVDRYPELGQYDIFEMTFIPSKSATNYESIVSIFSFVERSKSELE